MSVDVVRERGTYREPVNGEVVQATARSLEKAAEDGIRDLECDY